MATIDKESDEKPKAKIAKLGSWCSMLSRVKGVVSKRA